jgi:multicomponent Na+:H+ antiporter subunit G
MLIVDVLIAVFVLTGALLMVTSALAMFRAKDALSRINVFSPATGLGMPLVLLGCYIYTLQHEGFSVYRLLIAIVGFLSFIIVSSIASNTLSRSTVLAGSPVHRYTRPNRLVEPLMPVDGGETGDPTTETEPAHGDAPAQGSD